jgi:hypothetical protein
MKCRHCNAVFGLAPGEDVIDLGVLPSAARLISQAELTRTEPALTLRVVGCISCGLVQRTELFSSCSPVCDAGESLALGWRRAPAHDRDYLAAALSLLRLDPGSQIVQFDAGAGELLGLFVDQIMGCTAVLSDIGSAHGSPSPGIDRIEGVFDRRAAQRFVADRGRVDLVIIDNRLEQVADPHEMLATAAELLADRGAVSLEFPHLLATVRGHQFDAVRHERSLYLSLQSLERMLARHELAVWDVQTLPDEGGSLRVWAGRQSSRRTPERSLYRMRESESLASVGSPALYAGFQTQADRIRDALLAFLRAEKNAGRRVAGWGACARGITLLNYAGIGPELIEYVADDSPQRQNTWLPGSRIPVVPEARLRDTPADVVLILPWTRRDELIERLTLLCRPGTRFVTALPTLTSA